MALRQCFRLQQAVRALQRGELVAYPTEGVWGLGCDPDNPWAIQELLALKRRAPGKGLILVAATESQLDAYLCHLSDNERDQLRQSWPGPNTWLVPAPAGTSAWITGGRDTIALRVSAHPTVHALCEAFGGAIVSTSANVSGRSAATTPWQLQQCLGNTRHRVTIVPGRLTQPGKVSTIRELRSGKIIR